VPGSEGLTAEHRRAILAALPPNVVMTDEAWAALEEIVVGFRGFRSVRRRYLADWRRWRRIGDLTTKLAAEIKLLSPEAPWSARALDILQEVNNRPEILYHATRRAFRGTQDPHREFLYWGVLRVWTDQLGGELKYSMSRKGKPGGPLVRFFTACVEPVLKADETPRAGIADIIDREKESRRLTNRWKQKLSRGAGIGV